MRLRAKPVSHDDYDDDTDFDLMIHSRESDNEIIPFFSDATLQMGIGDPFNC